MRSLFLVFCFITLGYLIGHSQSDASFKEYEKVFTTYPFSDPDPIASQGLIYPYFRFDGFTNTPRQQKWKVVELENDFIRLLILPEIGGKIWTAIDKKSGEPFIYYNQVIKFRDVAMRGPWTSGGLEANYGIIGHTPNCATPVDYLVRKNADRSVSCFISVPDLLTRTRWQIEINIPHDKAYFTTRSFWYNPTPIEQPYYHWMNAGIKVKGNLEFIFPGTHYIGHAGEYDDWPVNKTNNKAINFYNNNDFGSYKSYHVFGKYTNFFGAYWHDDELGMVRYAPYAEKAGKKIWIWGLSRQGMIWEKILTDNDGQYAEIQSGRLYNQNAEQSSFTPFKHTGFAPQATDQWTEYWYPVRYTRGIKVANDVASANILQENGWLKWYCYPTQNFSDSLFIYSNGKRIHSQVFRATANQLIKDSIKVVSTEDYGMNIPGIELEWKSDTSFQNLKRPLQTPESFNWKSTYGLFLQGKELMDQKQFGMAEKKLLESLEQDPNYLPALLKLAELNYRNGKFDAAFEYARKAIAIDTHHGDANYYFGISALQIGDFTSALDGLSIASLTPSIRTAAYTEIAKLYMLKGNWNKSIDYADKALDFNRLAIAAREVKVIALRKSGHPNEAMQVLKELEIYQPLSPFVKMEKSFLGTGPKLSSKDFERNELPGEVWLELTTTYTSLGLDDDAETVLLLAGDQTMPLYWRAYLKSKHGDAYQQLLEMANQASALQVFPFRTELLPVFRWAANTSIHWKPRYYLALLLHEKNQNDAAVDLITGLKDIPDFAPFYALRAIWKKGEASAVTDFEKAINLDPGSWRYYKLLAQHYIQLKYYDKALKVAEDFNNRNPEHFIMQMLYAKTLLLNKKYKECDDLLSRLEIIPFEGATEGRILYWEAKLMQAVGEMEQKKYKQALRLIDQASSWPENLGVGKPYESDLDSRLENWLRYTIYKSMGKKIEAEMVMQSILDFKPGIYNTVMNFQPANHLITAWAMEHKMNKDAAVSWLDEQIRLYPDMKWIKWAKQVFVEGKFDLSQQDDAGVRIISRLK